MLTINVAPVSYTHLDVYKRQVFGAADKAAGEWGVFMIGCIYTGVACLRNGLWDRHFSDTPPANAVWSLVAAVAVTLIIGFSRGYWVGAAFTGVFTGILCLSLIHILPDASNIWKPPGPGCAHGASAAPSSS